MPDTPVIYQKRGRIGHITLDRAERDNAIDGVMVQALRNACDAAAGDPEVRVALLSGKGNVFCRGWDWASIAGEAATGEELVESLRLQGLLEDPFGCLADLPKPVVCAINGHALGAGLALALACDVRIAAADVRLGLPESEQGLLPLGGAIQRLSRLAGRGKALDMVLTGATVDAEEALRLGLVSAVVPGEKLLAQAQAVAERIAERGPLALQFAKEAVLRGTEMPLEQALRFETDLTVILQTTEDRAEGVKAFLEKRKPDFKGR